MSEAEPICGSEAEERLVSRFSLPGTENVNACFTDYRHLLTIGSGLVPGAARVQKVAELLPAAADSARHSADGQAEQRRDVLLPTTMPIEELENVSELGWQLSHCVAKNHFLSVCHLAAIAN